MTAQHFEFAVIGGAKGGKTLATRMAAAGHTVVMVEKGMIGGSCINVACIPTKTMITSARVRHLVQYAADYGVSATAPVGTPRFELDLMPGAMSC